MHETRGGASLERPVMTLVVTGNGGTVRGFPYFWLKYIHGAETRHHCAKGLLGWYSKRVHKDLTLGLPAKLDEVPAHKWDVAYLCGNSLTWANNVHLPLVPTAGETVELRTYNGLTITVTNAIALPIPELPWKWRGLPKNFTTCRNFRFAVAHYGYHEPELAPTLEL